MVALAQLSVDVPLSIALGSVDQVLDFAPPRSITERTSGGFRGNSNCAVGCVEVDACCWFLETLQDCLGARSFDVVSSCGVKTKAGEV
jgi:hypothetical protein